MTGFRRSLVDLFLVFFVIVVDRVVKCLALSFLIPGTSERVGSVLGIDLFWTLTFNTGAAWGVFDEIPYWLLFFRIVFLGLLLAMYLSVPMRPVSRAALAIILAGAVGNIIDTMVWGHVVDMIHLQLWGWDYPVFNVADSAICIGVATMLLGAFPSGQKSTGS
jgi:signal peptidase II